MTEVSTSSPRNYQPRCHCDNFYKPVGFDLRIIYHLLRGPDKAQKYSTRKEIKAKDLDCPVYFGNYTSKSVGTKHHGLIFPLWIPCHGASHDSSDCFHHKKRHISPFLQASILWCLGSDFKCLLSMPHQARLLILYQQDEHFDDFPSHDYAWSVDLSAAL